jgi:hypothetical protein
MKQVYFTVFIMILYSLTASTQSVNFPGYEELKKIKNEMSNSTHSGNEIDNSYYKSSPNGMRSVMDDFGTPPEWDWIKTYGGSGKDVAREVVTSEDGSMFIVGSFSGNMSIASNNYSSIGRRDAFLAKFQSDGTLIWIEQFSPSVNESMDAFGLCLDESENIYITGYYTGDVSFGDFDLSGIQKQNLFLISTDPDGEVTMATKHSTPYSKEMGLKVDTDNEGNIYVLGSTDGTTSNEHPSVISKYSTEGALILDYFHTQCFSDMQIFGEHIYFTGTINDETYIGDNYFNPYLSEAFVAKSTTNLEFVWVKMAEHIDYYPYSVGSSLFVSSSEELFIIGTASPDIRLGSVSADINGGFIASCSATGDFIWVSEILEEDEDIPTDISGNDDFIFVSTSIAVEHHDNYFTTTKWNASNGEFISQTSFDNEIEAFTYNSNSNSLIVTQDIDEYISLSMYAATSFEQEWNLFFEGNSAKTHGIGMDIDQYGFIYNYGYTSNKINHTGQLIDKGLFLAKQNGLGNTLWTIEFPGADDNSIMPGNHIKIDTNDNFVYITGLFYEPFTIPDGSTLVPDNSGSIFILKYDYNGVFQWAVQEDFKCDHLCLTNDYSGNVLLSGVFYNTINIGSSTFVSAGYKDILIAKYDNFGQLVWANSIEGDDMEWDALISTDAQDNIYLTSEFLSTNLIIDDINLTFEDGDGNILLAKFDSQGTALWAKVKAGSPIQWGDYYGWPTGIQTDSEGNTYIKGWHADSAVFDNTMLISSLDIPHYYDKFVAKFDAEGNTIWANSISEHITSNDYNQFDIDKSGNVYSCYRVSDNIIFEGDFTYFNTGKNDLVIAKYSNSGDLDWVKSIEDSESGNANITSIAANNPETVYVYGWFDNFLDFGSSSIVASNQNSFMGVLGESLDIKEYQDNKAFLFTLYPNPANQVVNILIDDDSFEETEILINDISGRTIYSQFFPKGEQSTSVDISEFSSGIYFVKLKSGKNVGVEKLVVD